MTEAAGGFTPPSGWTLKGTFDFNADGTLDAVVSQGTTNQLWILNSGSVSQTVNLPEYAGWSFLGIVDQNGDGTPDLLYSNPNGSWGSHVMSGATVGAAGGAANHTPATPVTVSYTHLTLPTNREV